MPPTITYVKYVEEPSTPTVTGAALCTAADCLLVDSSGVCYRSDGSKLPASKVLRVVVNLMQNLGYDFFDPEDARYHPRSIGSDIREHERLVAKLVGLAERFDRPAGSEARVVDKVCCERQDTAVTAVAPARATSTKVGLAGKASFSRSEGLARSKDGPVGAVVLGGAQENSMSANAVSEGAKKPFNKANVSKSRPPNGQKRSLEEVTINGDLLAQPQARKGTKDVTANVDVLKVGEHRRLKLSVRSQENAAWKAAEREAALDKDDEERKERVRLQHQRQMDDIRMAREKHKSPKKRTFPQEAEEILLKRQVERLNQTVITQAWVEHQDRVQKRRRKADDGNSHSSVSVGSLVSSVPRKSTPGTSPPTSTTESDPLLPETLGESTSFDVSPLGTPVGSSTKILESPRSLSKLRLWEDDSMDVSSSMSVSSPSHSALTNRSSTWMDSNHVVSLGSEESSFNRTLTRPNGDPEAIVLSPIAPAPPVLREEYREPGVRRAVKRTVACTAAFVPSPPQSVDSSSSSARAIFRANDSIDFGSSVSSFVPPKRPSLPPRESKFSLLLRKDREELAVDLETPSRYVPEDHPARQKVRRVEKQNLNNTAAFMPDLSFSSSATSGSCCGVNELPSDESSFEEPSGAEDLKAGARISLGKLDDFITPRPKPMPKTARERFNSEHNVKRVELWELELEKQHPSDFSESDNSGNFSGTGSPHDVDSSGDLSLPSACSSFNQSVEEQRTQAILAEVERQAGRNVRLAEVRRKRLAKQRQQEEAAKAAYQEEAQGWRDMWKRTRR